MGVAGNCDATDELTGVREKVVEEVDIILPTTASVAVASNALQRPNGSYRTTSGESFETSPRAGNR